MKLRRSLVAVVALISLTAIAYAPSTTTEAHAGATVTVLNARDTSISGVFACTNDPTWGVQLLSVTAVEHETGTGKVVTSFTSLGVAHYNDAFNQILFDASGFSFDIGPTVDRQRLTTGSVAGTLPMDVFSFPGGSVNASFRFTFTADTSKPTIEGPCRNSLHPTGYTKRKST
jgi:hypothetical protein